jgi:hypothetical protein
MKNDSTVARRIHEEAKGVALPHSYCALAIEEFAMSLVPQVSPLPSARRISPNDGAEDTAIIKQCFGNLKFHGI